MHFVNDDSYAANFKMVASGGGEYGEIEEERLLTPFGTSLQMTFERDAGEEDNAADQKVTQPAH